MKPPSKLTEITDLKDFTPVAGKIYLFNGVRVPCPNCSICIIASLGIECKFMKI